MTGVVDEYVLGLDVFVDQAASMGVTERRRQVNGNAQYTRQIERLSLQNTVEGLTARVGEYKECPSFVTRERQRLGRPCGIQFGGKRVFVLKPPQILGQRLFRGSTYYQNGRRIAPLPAAVKRKARAFTDGLQEEFGGVGLDGYPRRHGCATCRSF
jgi:hypothetical protein